jgi:hypothetical protein
MNMSDPIRLFELLFNQTSGKLFRDGDTGKRNRTNCGTHGHYEDRPLGGSSRPVEIVNGVNGEGSEQAASMLNSTNFAFSSNVIGEHLVR